LAATLTAGLLIAGVVLLAVVALTGMYFYPRFVISLVVLSCALISFGLVGPPVYGLTAARKFSRAGEITALAGYLVCIGVFAITQLKTSREIDRLRWCPISPLRETAAFLRGREVDGAAIFAYGFGSEALQYYLPQLPFAREADAASRLEAALKAADEAGKPLLVAVGYEELNRRQLAPDGFPLLDDPERFEEVARFRGIEPLFGYRVLASRQAQR
jgi:hypothetical protein